MTNVWTLTARLQLHLFTTALTFVDDELSSIGWWRGEALADVKESVLLATSGRCSQRVFALEEAGPRRVQPILVLDVGLFAGVAVRLLADFVILLFYILRNRT